MASTVSAVLPLQLLCQLIAPGADNFNNSTIVNIAVNRLPSPEEITKLPEGYVSYPDIGIAYKIHNERVTWATARKLCFDQGSQLALIDTPKKMEHLVSQKAKVTGEDLHVGIHKFDGSWISSSDGSPVSSSVPWDTNQPAANQSCARLSVYQSRNIGKLFAYPCSDRLQYVCEIPFPASNSAE